MPSVSRNLPLITKDELASHNNSKSVYVCLDGRKVYDVTSFIDEHPGGGDLILNYAGKDITDILKDVDSHEHSEAAYEMMDDIYLVAILATDEEERKILTADNRDSFVITEKSESEKELFVTTDFSRDYKTNRFLDLNKPLAAQVLFGDFQKEFYLEQVHKPRHYGKGSAPIFGNFLEPLSKTPWFTIPLIWIPFDLFCVYRALQGLPFYFVFAGYVLGLFIWTLLEYLLHRFLFHLDYYLPDHPVALTLHFLLHGVHHYLPMDGLRLVMPPALLVALAYPFYNLAHLLFPFYFAMSVFSGSFMGYVMYDCTHYFLHHVQLPAYMKALKKHHLDHHYKNYDVGFGVTSSFWDNVFGTEFVDSTPKSRGL